MEIVELTINDFVAYLESNPYPEVRDYWDVYLTKDRECEYVVGTDNPSIPGKLCLGQHAYEHYKDEYPTELSAIKQVIKDNVFVMLDGKICCGCCLETLKKQAHNNES
ncbi:MAG: hypothetical protein ACYTF1_17970 [Planctomycetota bacterium]|jgi:hypothetical protein